MKRSPLRRSTAQLQTSTPLSRGTGLERSEKPLRPRTEKRAAQERAYRPERDAYLLAHPICQNPSCNRPAVDLHHQAGRNGKRLLNTRYWLALCRECHELCKRQPLLALEIGLTVTRHRPLEER